MFCSGATTALAFVEFAEIQQERMFAGLLFGGVSKTPDCGCAGCVGIRFERGLIEFAERRVEFGDEDSQVAQIGAGLNLLALALANKRRTIAKAIVAEIVLSGDPTSYSRIIVEKLSEAESWRERFNAAAELVQTSEVYRACLAVRHEKKRQKVTPSQLEESTAFAVLIPYLAFACLYASAMDNEKTFSDLLDRADALSIERAKVYLAAP